MLKGKITKQEVIKQKVRSPRIASLSWGRLEVGDKSFKDVKLFPGGAKEWDWRETGTRHVPGVKPADVEELLDHGVTVVVIAKGFYGRLGVCPDTLKMLENRDVPVYVENTEEAVRLYNGLREDVPVGALIHSTC